MQLCYLIFTSTNLSQIQRLVNVIQSGDPDSTIVLHHDPIYFQISLNDFQPAGKVHLLENPTHIEWGDFSFVQAILRSLTWVLNNIEFEWLIFISGQDYPIQPVNSINKFLGETSYDGFVKGYKCNITRFSLPKCERDVINFNRYYFQYVKLPSFFYKNGLFSKKNDIWENVRSYLNRSQLIFRIIRGSYSGMYRYASRIGIRSFNTPFSKKFPCYKGSTWFTLNYRSVCHLIAYVMKSARFVSYYERTFLPDESFIPTILFNAESLNIKNDNLLFTVWSKQNNGHPDILMMKHYDQIISSGYHFARKFDVSIDHQVLDALDAHIGHVSKK